MRVFFGTPSYDKQVTVDFHTSMVQASILLTSRGIECQHHVHAGDPFLCHGRTAIVEAFLASDATDLIFVDADVGFDPQVLGRVLAYEHEIVGGLVPKRNEEREDVFHQNALTGEMSIEGLFRTMELPTAFMRVKRSVFERLPKPWFRIGASASDYGEDIFFNRRCTEARIPMWVDSDITFAHRGTKAWRGNFYEHCVATGLLRKRKAAGE